jgi:hypothetical protein
MVQVVVLSANGEQRTLKTTAIQGKGQQVTGAAVAKALRKTKPAELIGNYLWGDIKLMLWGWKDGKAGTENKHDLPPPHDEILLFGDVLVIAEDVEFTVDQWLAFYDDAFKGFEELGDEDTDEEEEEEVEEEEDEVEEEVEEAEEEEEVEEEEEADAEEEVEEEEVEEEDENEDCYDDGDEAGGGSGKRRAPRRRTTSAAEYRHMDMGLRSRVKIPTPIGKRAPRWQTGAELEEEAYDC